MEAINTLEYSVRLSLRQVIYSWVIRALRLKIADIIRIVEMNPLAQKWCRFGYWKLTSHHQHWHHYRHRTMRDHTDNFVCFLSTRDIWSEFTQRIFTTLDSTPFFFIHEFVSIPMTMNFNSSSSESHVIYIIQNAWSKAIHNQTWIMNTETRHGKIVDFQLKILPVDLKSQLNCIKMGTRICSHVPGIHRSEKEERENRISNAKIPIAVPN